jgi:hypothetical protein
MACRQIESQWCVDLMKERAVWGEISEVQLNRFRKHLSHSFPVIESPVHGLIMCNLDGCQIACAATAGGVGPNEYRGAGAILYAIWRVASPRFGQNLVPFLTEHVHCCNSKFRESGADVQIEALSRR